MKKKFIMILSLVILLFPISVFADEVCPLGPNVTRDLYGVLMILKIAAPLLCIGLSVFDAVKAVAKGDPATDLKVVSKRFFKRIIYAFILFFIPVLVDLFFQMADVWGANGSCDIMNPPEELPDLYFTVRCAQHSFNKSECVSEYGCEYYLFCFDTYQDGDIQPPILTTTENCAEISDKEHCDRDQKCYWSNNDNACHVKSSNDTNNNSDNDTNTNSNH